MMIILLRLSPTVSTQLVILSGLVSKVRAVIYCRFSLNIGDFPALVPHVLAVEGEVYTVSKEVLAKLDRLEGVDSGMYRRRYIYVFDEDGVRDEVHTYMWGRVIGSTHIKLARWSDFQ